MFFIIGLPLIVFVVGLVLAFTVYKYEGMVFFVVAVLAIASAPIGLGISFGVGAIAPPDFTLDRETRLVSIKDVQGVEGRFGFLGSGYIRSRFYYTFYEDVGDGSKFGRINANKTIVHEEERDDALLRVYKKDAGWLFGLTPKDEKYEVFIPEGSILHDFELDLE